MNNKLVFPLKDINGNDVFENEYVGLNNKVYIAMYVDKGESGWVLHPCNKNININDLKLLNNLEIMTVDVKIDG